MTRQQIGAQVCQVYVECSTACVRRQKRKRTFDDSWQVEELDACTSMPNHAGDAGEGGKLIGGYFGKGAGELVEERRLADGWEADETDTGVANLVDVKAVATRPATTGARGWLEEFPAKLGKLCLLWLMLVRATCHMRLCIP